MVAGHLREKKGYYYAVLNYTDSLGKRKTKWISTGLTVKGNKKRAEAILMDARRNFNPEEPKVMNGDILFADYMEQWLDIIKSSVAVPTFASYSTTVKRVVAPYFREKEITLKNLAAKDIQEFYMKELQRVSASSVIHYHANIHKALKYAVKIDLIDVNPADKVERPKKDRYVGSFYDADEVNALFEAAKGSKLELPILFGAFYGLRRSEAIGLKWDAIDFEQNTITIRHTVTSCDLDGKRVLVASDTTKTKSSSLTTIRKLKEHNVEVYFEKENIWTFDSKGELLLTIMSSLAQEESRSISENCTWGQRKRFADGKVTVPFKRFLGYDMGPDHNLVVNPEQAKLVKRIYGMFLQGQSPFQIARTLTDEGIPSPGGKDHWNPSNIKSILTNEKYKGDALLQKSFTVDFLTKKKKTNEGEIPQYYVKDNHEAIIDPETFEMVQTLMATRKKGRNRKSSVSIFSSKVKCGDCGSWYGPKVWHSNDAYRKVIWQCNHKFDGEKCATPTLTEDEIKELFLRAANQVIDQKEQFIAIYEQVLSKSLDTTALEGELNELEVEINIAAELIEECIKENAHVALDQAEYQKRYDVLVARFDKAKARHTEVTDLITERTARRHQIETYLKELRSREPLTEFRETDWLAMVDYITVHSKDDIRVTFKDGTEIKA